MSERMTMQMVTASVLGSLLFFTVSFAEWDALGTPL